MQISSSISSPKNRWLESIGPVVRFVWRGKWPAGRVESMRYLYDHELVIVSQGKCRLIFARRELVFKAPAYFIIPPGVAHESVALVETVRDCIHFDWKKGSRQSAPLWTYLPAPLQANRIRPAPPGVPSGLLHGSIPDMPRIMALAASLRVRWNQIADADRLGARAALLEILVQLLSQDTPSAQVYSDRLAENMKSLLERNMLSSEPVSEILKSIGLSHAHLCRVFRSAYDTTPVAYLNSLRLERARQLLREGHLSVAEAARASGFADVSYFGRLFRRHEGNSPRDYRFRS